MTLFLVFLTGNEFTHTVRFLTQITVKENIPHSSVLLKSHHGILKTWYSCYSVIHFVLSLPRYMSYVEIVYIGIVMGED